MRLILLTSFVLSFLSVAAWAADPRDDTLPKFHKLPKDADAAVLVLDYRGGFTAGPRPVEPYLVIRANGTVEVMKFGAQQPVKSKIAAEELQDLLRFVIDDHGFLEVDNQAVKKAMQDDDKRAAEAAQTNGGIILVRPQVADAATIVLRAHANGKQNEVSVYALGMKARQYPKVVELTQLSEIQKKLSQFAQDVLRDQQNK